MPISIRAPTSTVATTRTLPSSARSDRIGRRIARVSRSAMDRRILPRTARDVHAVAHAQTAAGAMARCEMTCSGHPAASNAAPHPSDSQPVP